MIHIDELLIKHLLKLKLLHIELLKKHRKDNTPDKKKYESVMSFWRWYNGYEI